MSLLSSVFPLSFSLSLPLSLLLSFILFSLLLREKEISFGQRKDSMFAKTSPSRNISDLILQTELKHPVFDSEQHFLESRSLLHFLFI